MHEGPQLKDPVASILGIPGNWYTIPLNVMHVLLYWPLPFLHSLYRSPACVSFMFVIVSILCMCNVYYLSC